MNFDAITASVSKFFRKNGGTILTWFSAAGVVGTAYLSGKAAVKADRELTKLRQKEWEKTGKEPSLQDKAKAVAPIYIPPVAIGAATIACMFGANGLNRRQQASMLAAGAVVERTFKKYRDQVSEMLGDASVKADLSGNPPEVQLDKDERLFYYNYYQDGEYPEYGSYFQSTAEKVLRAEMELNRIFIMRRRATLNDFFNLLDLKPIEGGDNLGWTDELGQEYYGYSWVDFEHYDAKLEDGLECTIISTPYPPTILE